MDTKNLNYHPDRERVIAETHARPSQPLFGPAVILHIAFRAENAVFNQYFQTLNSESEVPETLRHRTGKIGNIVVKLERHTEFMSCTLFHEFQKGEQPEDLLHFFQQTFLMDGIEVLTLLRFEMVNSAREMVTKLPVDHRFYGGCFRSDIEARSNFHPDKNGIIQFTVFAKGKSAHETGRRIQRLIEMETYRTMALLGLSKARRAGVKLGEYEANLDRLTSISQSEESDDKSLFHDLSELSEKSHALMTETRYRYAASRAYYRLFEQRVETLEEEKVGDVQTMSGFLRSRLEPAMATIESTAKRQETLIDDLSRALVLLRTRIELSLNEGNQALLRSMDKRHDQQLKISQAVEGLSIVAITYYAVGLVSYLLKVLAKEPWMPFSAPLLTAISVPIIFFLVFVALRKMRKSWEKHTDG